MSSTAALVEGGDAPVKTSRCSLLAKIIIGVSVSVVIVVGAACAGYFLTDSGNAAKLNSNLTGTDTNQTTVATTSSFAPSQTSQAGQTGNPVTLDPNVGEQTGGPVVGEKTGGPVIGEQTVSPVAGGQTGSLVTGGQTMGPVSGGKTVDPVVGGQTGILVTGGQTIGSATGEQTVGPFVGGQTAGSVTGEQTIGPIVGEQTLDPVVGEQTPGPTLDSFTGGQTVNPVDGEQTNVLFTGTQTVDPFIGGQTNPVDGEQTVGPVDGEQTSWMLTEEQTTPSSTQLTTTPEPLCSSGLTRTVILAEYSGTETVWLRGENVPLHHRYVNAEYALLAQGDTHLDWDGKESGQVSQALGTPTVKTTNDVSSSAYHPLNTFGPNYWIMDACIDCSAHSQFQFKMFINAWESFASDPVNSCVGGGNHLAHCGKLNIFHHNSQNCQIINLPVAN